MPLEVGSTLGVYEVLSAIGAGGMGEVYKARDSKLDRDVALKILPEAFVNDQEHLVRFQREAKVLASLNHPNIAAIHGLEESGGSPALVLEYIEGPTLQERIAQGPIPLDEALPIVRQIAEALEAAHEQGIIHRDLKPANVKVKDDGTVKVLDFGLAKALERDLSDTEAAKSPTMTAAATKMGVIMGTAAYMAPEQAAGKRVDRRADIWAFGVVLWEMLTGRQLFTGESVSHVLASVLKTDPDWTALPADTPGAIRRLLRRCLDRNHKQRLPDAVVARLEIDDALANANGDSGEALMPSARRTDSIWHRPAPLLVGAVVIALLSGFAVWGLTRAAPIESELATLQLMPPQGTGFDAIAVSPDGRRLAYAASDAAGNAQLWVRPLVSMAAQPLAGTEGASYPFWSPDSRFIGFFADGQLKTIEASGGIPQTVCDIGAGWGVPRGGSWGRDGTILFGVNPFYPAPLYRVPASGGEPRPTLTLDPSAQVNQMWPTFLPDGRHFLYHTVHSGQPDRTGVYLASLESEEGTRLLGAASGTAYAPDPDDRDSGFILFLRDQTLMAQRFDTRQSEIVGDAVPVAQEVGVNPETRQSRFSVSQTGVLAYSGGTGTAQLVWFDRAGNALEPLGSPRVYIDVKISPDGSTVAAQIEDGLAGADVWLLDTVRGTSPRLTFYPTYNLGPTWSPDGTRITFTSMREGSWDLYQKSTVGAGDAELFLSTENNLVASQWSA